MSELAVVESRHEHGHEHEHEQEGIQLVRERSTEGGKRWEISRQDWID